MNSIYEFQDYKKYLEVLVGRARQRTGLRQKLAQHLSCQTAYISQVLNGSANLSLEQALKTNEFLNHDRDQSKMFMLLVSKARAGTRDLERYFQQQIDELVKTKNTVHDRVKKDQILSRDDQSRYYSAWYYSAVHLAVMISELQTPRALAARLQLPLQTVSDTLDFLVKARLVKYEGGRYKVGSAHIHLPDDSRFIYNHHLNWRMLGLRSLDTITETDLRYSVLYSVSRADARRIKNQILDLIKANLAIVEPSKDETLFCNIIDFFELNKN